MLDLEWKLIFVSSPGDEALDQELDDCLVGPVPSGVNSFEFEGSAPDPSKIPEEDVLGVAALILTGSYRDQEFVRVGYYQNTEYDNEEMKETPPAKIMFHRLVRDISTKPRVTRFHIKWYVVSTVKESHFQRRVLLIGTSLPLRSHRQHLVQPTPPQYLQRMISAMRMTTRWRWILLGIHKELDHDKKTHLRMYYRTSISIYYFQARKANSLSEKLERSTFNLWSALFYIYIQLILVNCASLWIVNILKLNPNNKLCIKYSVLPDRHQVIVM